ESLIRDRFVLYAQEIQANHATNIKWHGEFLIRMLDENNELIFPDKFIPAAERYHLMVEIDKWVIKEGFSFIKKLEDKYNGNVLCAINLSGQSVCDKDFLDFVIDELHESNISPASVCFEITETAAVSNFFYAEKMLEILKGMGCSFSLDDFGSGLSSFGYLKKLNVDYLKIDGSFVRAMLEDKKDYALVKSINQVGKEMGMKTIAEFVESETLNSKLKEMNVDFSQGYGIAKPVPLSSLV
ncbi:MAG: EAL domain-containing protein, partial [Gammaproteobacteria bacterium]|nr:EAL domain-containing protein [Gammaproteobacteria bacterium]